MPSIYIKCDKCNKTTFMGEDWHPRGLGWGDSSILYKEAMENGWRIDRPNVWPPDEAKHYCPDCNA